MAILGTSLLVDATRSAICKVIAWDLQQIKKGQWDALDENGEPHKPGSARAKLAGKQMPVKAVACLCLQRVYCQQSFV